MDDSTYEPSGVSRDCENCILCRMSTRAHSWKTSGQTVWGSTCQRGRKAFKDMIYREVPEGAQRCEEESPRTITSLLQVTGSKLAVWRSVGLSKCRSTITYKNIARRAEHVKHFLVKYNNEIFLCVCILVLLGTVYSLFPSSYTSSQPLEFFLLISFTGFLLCWGAVCWWAQQNFCHHEDSISQYSECSLPSEVLLEKPPEYESLVPLVSDTDLPAYEDLTLTDRDLQGLLSCSIAVSHEVSLCEVHQPSGVRCPPPPGGSVRQDLKG